MYVYMYMYTYIYIYIYRVNLGLTWVNPREKGGGAGQTRMCL